MFQKIKEGLFFESGMNMKKLTVVLSVVLLASFAFGSDVIVRDSRGRGRSRPEAIKQALYDAVSQAKGVAVSSGDVSVGLQSSTLDIDTYGGNKTVSVDALAIQGETTSLKTRAAGMVKSYEVISESEVDGLYEVNLKVSIYAYQTPLTSARRRLAVMPLRSMAFEFDFLGLKTSSKEMEKLMAMKLTGLLGGTNKFSILDRDHIEEFAFEQKILLSDAVSIKEKAKLSEIMGCDFMLVGTIRRAGIIAWSESSAAIGRVIYEYEGDFVFEYRVIAAATSQILVSDEIVLSLDNAEVKKLSERWRPKRLDMEEMRDNLITMAAKEVVDGIVDATFPVKVVKITSTGEVIFNQGGKRFVEGQIYDVFGVGEVLINPDTGEGLGTEEIRAGQVRVIRVKRAVAYAEVVSGDVSAIKAGMLCRYQKSDAADDSGYKRSNIQKTGDGGVKLPFD